MGRGRLFLTRLFFSPKIGATNLFSLELRLSYFYANYREQDYGMHGRKHCDCAWNMYMEHRSQWQCYHIRLLKIKKRPFNVGRGRLFLTRLFFSPKIGATNLFSLKLRLSYFYANYREQDYGMHGRKHCDCEWNVYMEHRAQWQCYHFIFEIRERPFNVGVGRGRLFLTRLFVSPKIGAQKISFAETKTQIFVRKLSRTRLWHAW